MTTTTVESVDRHIGRTVHAHLWERRITQRRLAVYLGLDETIVSRMLRGTRSWSLLEVCATAAMLNVPVPELLPANVAAMWAPSDSNRQPTGLRRRRRRRRRPLPARHAVLPGPRQADTIIDLRDRVPA